MMKETVLTSKDYTFFDEFRSQVEGFAKEKNIPYAVFGSTEEVARNDGSGRYKIIALYSENKDRAILLMTEDSYLIGSKRGNGEEYIPTVEVWYSTEMYEDGMFETSEVEVWIEASVDALIPYLNDHLGIGIESLVS